jgi:hypothetical protein
MCLQMVEKAKIGQYIYNEAETEPLELGFGECIGGHHVNMFGGP